MVRADRPDGHEELGRKEPDMLIIGVDYHPSDQYIALVDTETGEYKERQLKMKASGGRRSCGATKDEHSWKSFRWVPGPPGVGRICWNCWTG
jgi:hypothetical protein